MSVLRYVLCVSPFLVFVAHSTSAWGCPPGQATKPPLAGSLSGFLEELNDLVPTLLASNDVPGAAVGIEDGRTLATVGFGFADREKEIRVTDRHAFNVGSISKTVASWGVMKRVQQRQVGLDTPVGQYLTRWQLPASDYDHDGVTLRRLLSHTAGLSLPGYPGFSVGAPLPTLEESLSGATNGAGSVFVEREPGARWQYSGGGFTLAQLIVEEVTGQKFSDYMEDEVLEPLGMTSSSFEWDAEIDSIAAKPYGPTGKAIVAGRFTAKAAAGLQTTLHDLTRFALASMGRLGGLDGTRGVLRRDTLELMQTPLAEVPADAHTAVLDPRSVRRASVSYGLGYQLARVGTVEFASHGGVNDG